jgi:DNA-binding GntR family transcriptional regulator
LNRLDVEGLVRTLSRAGGVVVAETSEQEMVDIYELRMILDSGSARLACQRMSDADLERLREIVEETKRVTPEGNVHAIVQAHAKFHFLLYAASGNPELERVARNLWDRSYRFRVMALSNAENARRGLAQHAEILAALQARDAVRAAALAEAHDQSSIQHLRPRLAKMAGSETTGLGPPAPGGR